MFFKPFDVQASNPSQTSLTHENEDQHTPNEMLQVDEDLVLDSNPEDNNQVEQQIIVNEGEQRLLEQGCVSSRGQVRWLTRRMQESELLAQL